MHLPIHIASSSGNKNLLKRLIDTTAPHTLEVKNEYGKTPLMLAIVSNNIDCVSLLLKAGVHVDNSDTSGQTALHVAANKGFHRCIKLLLSHNASYQQKDFSGVTPLHLAAINPNSKCLFAILKVLKPGETDIQDISKKTALHWCSAYAIGEHIKMLLLKGANPCIPDVEGKTPLHWAALNPNIDVLECVKILLEKEGSLINWQDYEGRSALHLAVATGSAEVVRFLVSKEACDTDILDNVFCTPLHWAAKKGLFDKTDILLKKSIYTSADDNGATALHYAAYYNQTKTMEIFLSRSYIFDIGDAEGRNAVMWAAAKNSDDVIEVMAESGSDFGCSDKNGLTALHIAALNGHLTTIKLLVTYNVPIDAKDKYGFTALLRACQFGRAKASQLLIDLGADINVTDKDSRSVLHWCAIGGHAYLCQLLLHKGVSSNMQDTFGRTPLHYACMKNGYLNCVSVLLESEANPNIVDNEGKLPLHWAILANHGEIVKLLCDYDTDVNAIILSNKWITAFDLALSQNNSKIINLLKSSGALTLAEIKEIAAQKIQKWFRRRQFLKHICCPEKMPYFSSQNILSQTLVNHAYNASNSAALIHPRESVETPNFIISDENLRNYFEIDRDIAQSAAIIQRAWRKYSLKMKFLKMQTTIQGAFKTVQKRVNAEKEWCLKLQSFIDRW